MPKFGKRSKKELATAHADLQKLFNEVIKDFDCAVICGHRGRADQDKAFAEGKSKLKWPHSKHNSIPARAVDVVPWPSMFQSEAKFYDLALAVKVTAKRLGIYIRWGGDFKNFFDGPHFELI